MENVPDKAATLARMGRLPDIVGQAIAKATAEACKFFADGRPFNANLYADLTRYAARAVFATEQLEALDDDDFSLESHNIANIGLQLYCNGMLIKILKFGPNKTAPAPASAARLDFYNQAVSFVLDRRTNTLLPVDTNLLFLWDASSRSEASLASDLLLLCPAGVSKSLGVMWAWRESIILPQLSASDLPVFGASEERTDLDIREATSFEPDLQIGDLNETPDDHSEDESEPGTN